MNHETARILQARQEEVKRLGGQAAYTHHALRNLRIKTVIKESHGTPVQALCFNLTSTSLNNLFATVGSDQATIYDDEHMGDYVAVAVHFTNAPSEHAPGGELAAMAWLAGDAGLPPQPQGDALLAVGGADAAVSVISVAEARVVRLLRGHSKEVAELAACTARPALLLSLARDGELRLWHVPSETCLSSLQTDATAIAMSPDGCCFVTGNAKGRLHRYDIPLPTTAAVAAAAAAAAAGAAAAADGAAPGGGRQVAEEVPGPSEAGTRIAEGSRAEVRLEQGASHGDAIDCIRFLSDSRLVTKSTDGRMFVWRLADDEQQRQQEQQQQGSRTQAQRVGSLEAVAAWKVPSCAGGSGFGARTSFGSTPDGRYVAVGNSRGDCYVYDCESGERLTHVSAVRVSAPVRACGLSADGRHLVAAIGKGFVFRFEYCGGLEGGGSGPSSEEDKENSASSPSDGADTTPMATAKAAALLLVTLLAVAEAQVIGSTCASRKPADRASCCTQKKQQGIKDASCASPPAFGRTCATRAPAQQKACCLDKKNRNITDASCARILAPSPPPPARSPPPWKAPPPPAGPPAGGKCSTVTPANQLNCCLDKVDQNVFDPSCLTILRDWEGPAPAPAPAAGNAPHMAPMGAPAPALAVKANATSARAEGPRRATCAHCSEALKTLELGVENEVERSKEHGAAGGPHDQQPPPTATTSRAAAMPPLNRNVRLALWWSLFENASVSLRSGDILSALLFLETKSQGVVGLVQGLNGIVQLVAAVPAGVAADRQRRDSVLRAGAVVGALAGAWMAWALLATPRPAVGALAAAMALLGCYRGVYSSALEALFADSVERGRSGPYNWRFVVQLLSSSVGPAVSLALFLRLGNRWRLAECRLVLLSGLALMVVALVLMCRFSDNHSLHPSHAHRRRQQQLQQAQQQAQADSRQRPPCDGQTAREGAAGGGSNGELANGAALQHAPAPPDHEGAAAGAPGRRGWHPSVVVATLIGTSDLIGALASGMTLKFFGLFFLDACKMRPAGVSLVTRVFDILLLALLACLPTAAGGPARSLLVAVHLARMACANCSRAIMSSVLMGSVARRLFIERYGYQTTFLITACIKVLSFIPLTLLLSYVPDGFCASGARRAADVSPKPALVGYEPLAGDEEAGAAGGSQADGTTVGEHGVPAAPPAADGAAVGREPGVAAEAAPVAATTERSTS
eukprot:scaffold1.g5555.t1